MTAADHLSDVQFIGQDELRGLRTGEFGGTVGEMRPKWLADAADSPQARHTNHGGPEGYVAHLRSQIAAEGIKNPLTIATYPNSESLHGGHHRALAAMDLGLDKIPVRRRPIDDIMREAYNGR